MNWEMVGATGEIIGAIGVIASLIYLAIQIRNNDKSLQAQSLQSVLDGFRDRVMFQAYSNPEFADLLQRGQSGLEYLTASEKPRFQSVISEIVMQMQQVLQLYERGLLSKVDFDAWLFYTATVIQTPGGKAVWPFTAETITPTIRDLINEFLAQNPDTPAHNDLNPLWKYDGENDT